MSTTGSGTPGAPLGRGLVSLGFAALSPLTLVIAWLPTGLALWLGRRLGDLAWLTLRGRRRVALDNLARALGGERTPTELARIGRRSFQHLGMSLVEGCVLLFRPLRTILARMSFDGIEHVRAAAAKGRGVLMLTAHYGNWEWLAATHHLVAVPLSEVVRPLDHAVLEAVMGRMRRRTGVEIIPKRRAVSGIVDALRRGRMVGILLDQNAVRAEGVFVPFFGIPASTSKGMALLALRTRSPVVPVFIRREPGGRHRVEALPAIPAPRDRDVAAYTAAFNRAIETAIRRDPEQWLWLHRRWRTRPALSAPVRGEADEPPVATG